MTKSMGSVVAFSQKNFHELLKLSCFEPQKSSNIFDEKYSESSQENRP